MRKEIKGANFGRKPAAASPVPPPVPPGDRTHKRERLAQRHRTEAAHQLDEALAQLDPGSSRGLALIAIGHALLAIEARLR